MESRLRVGATCTWIVGACYFLIVIFAFLSPTSVASYVTSRQYFLDFESYHYDFVTLKCLMALANAGLVGVFIAFYALRDPKRDGAITLFTVLALIGVGIGMFQSVVDATQVPHLAEEYLKSSPEVQHVIVAFGVANPAIYALSLGLPGLWFIYVALAYRKTLPPFLVLLNLLWGVGNVTTVVAHLLVLIWLIYLVSAGALVASPFWTIWLARFFRRQAQTA